jgi:hypothetical protein
MLKPGETLLTNSVHPESEHASGMLLGSSGERRGPGAHEFALMMRIAQVRAREK